MKKKKYASQAKSSQEEITTMGTVSWIYVQNKEEQTFFQSFAEWKLAYTQSI